MFTSAEIETATLGFVDRKMCNNWSSRGLWISPLEPTRRGTHRKYSRTHLIEAAIRAELVRLGLTHELAREAIMGRVIYAAAVAPRTDGRDVDDSNRPGSSGILEVRETARGTESEAVDSNSSGSHLVIPEKEVRASIENLPEFNSDGLWIWVIRIETPRRGEQPRCRGTDVVNSFARIAECLSSESAKISATGDRLYAVVILDVSAVIQRLGSALRRTASWNVGMEMNVRS